MLTAFIKFKLFFTVFQLNIWKTETSKFDNKMFEKDDKSSDIHEIDNKVYIRMWPCVCG